MGPQDRVLVEDRLRAAWTRRHGSSRSSDGRSGKHAQLRLRSKSEPRPSSNRDNTPKNFLLCEQVHPGREWRPLRHDIPIHEEEVMFARNVTSALAVAILVATSQPGVT